MFEILIVDDTRSVHAFVKSLLSGATGLATTSAFNGRDAVELLKSGRKFDVVFLDWEMPLLNGPETLSELKKMGVTAPIVMMTTKSDPDDIRRMLELGVSEYLMKPFTVDILFEKIELVSGKSFSHVA